MHDLARPNDAPPRGAPAWARRCSKSGSIKPRALNPPARSHSRRVTPSHERTPDPPSESMNELQGKEKCINWPCVGSNKVVDERRTCKGNDMAARSVSEVIQHLRRTALLQDSGSLTDGQLLADHL